MSRRREHHRRAVVRPPCLLRPRSPVTPRGAVLGPRWSLRWRCGAAILFGSQPVAAFTAVGPGIHRNLSRTPGPASVLGLPARRRRGLPHRQI